MTQAASATHEVFNQSPPFEDVDLFTLDRPLAEAVAALARIVLGDQPFEQVLERLTEIAKRTIPGAFEVSVTMHDRHPATAASTGSFAAKVDVTFVQRRRPAARRRTWRPPGPLVGCATRRRAACAAGTDRRSRRR